MIISPPAETDSSVHRALWSLLPARAARVLAVLRPLAVLEAPRPARQGELAVALLGLALLAALQQWVWLTLLGAALAGTLASARVLRARAERIGAARQRAQQQELDLAARAARLASASAEALADALVALAERIVITMIIMVSTIPFFAALCRQKIKAVNRNLTDRIFGQQLAGAARQ